MEKECLAEITYLNHSGFSVETKDRFLIFDYFPGGREEWNYPEGVISPGVIDPDAIPQKQVTVFSSHCHHDHFDPRILQWRSRIPEISYVFSSDIKPGISGKRVLFLDPGQTVEFQNMEIRTLRSTDEGVAFLVKAGSLCIYHAGDLNWWHWNGESESYNKQMGEHYCREINRLKGEKIDLAFLPVDPRLEENYLLGLQYFMDTVGAAMVFPMHFWGDFNMVSQLREKLKDTSYQEKIALIKERGQVFSYPAFNREFQSNNHPDR